jgi:hypothetical protein
VRVPGRRSDRASKPTARQSRPRALRTDRASCRFDTHHLPLPASTRSPCSHRLRTPLSSRRWGQSRFCFPLLATERHVKPSASLLFTQHNAVFTAQPSMSNWGEQALGLWSWALLWLPDAVAVLKASGEQCQEHLSSYRLRQTHPTIDRMSPATSGPTSTSSRTTPSPYSSHITSSALATPSRGPHLHCPPLNKLPSWSSSCGESLPLLCLKWIHPPLDSL